MPRVNLAVMLACCLAAPSSGVRRESPAVEDYVTEQLTVVASAFLERRSQALVPKHDRDRRDMPTEVLGVRISPKLARSQERAVRELETRNRAPVAGGPAYTGARTRLDPARAVRNGDRITLEAVEHTEVKYGAAGRPVGPAPLRVPDARRADHPGRRTRPGPGRPPGQRPGHPRPLTALSEIPLTDSK